MQKVFVSYADARMAYSLKRIGKQARKLGIFDIIILATPDYLSARISENQQVKDTRCGGYIWKPLLIQQVLQEYPDSIVFYADAGCTLMNSSLWRVFFRFLDKYNAIFFQYSKEQPQWKRWGSDDSLMKHWTKKMTIQYCAEKYNVPELAESPQVLGGIFFVKSNGGFNDVVSAWADEAMHNPVLFADPLPKEKQHPEYVSHRHDQSILTAIALSSKTTLLFPEIIERYHPDSFIFASRIRASSFAQYCAAVFKLYVKRILGKV